MENLVQALAEVLRSPLASPLRQEIIIVQSRGMEHWLSMNLAKHHGVCANTRFPFPNTFLGEIYQAILPDSSEVSPFDPKILCWRIMEALSHLISRPGFEDLKNYLKGVNKELKRFQLSDRVADTFDQYLLFRPEMIFQWEEGKANHWQAILWRELVKGHENTHRAAKGRALFQTIESTGGRIDGFPERVSVFGISALPRFHVQVFSGISKFCQVNVFLMNPCREYWGDILSEWEIRRAKSRQVPPGISSDELHLEKGNPLLGSMGTLGRAFFDLMNEFDCDEWTSFEDPGAHHLLSQIQSDILNLREESSVEKRTLSGDDQSIQIHSCHSPMREIEILQDQLLELFEENPDLMPEDVLIMTPDIEAYAPYIQAVFDLPFSDPRRVPFSIADRSVRDESEIVEPFLAILDLPGGRFGVSSVLGILESEAVRKRFDLSETDLDFIREWIRETRIRWGLDAKDRHQRGLPSFPENTWEAGLERLLLGYAMAGEKTHLFRGRLPYDDLEGNGAPVLGGLLDFTDQLFKAVRSLEKPRTLEDWSDHLMGLLERFFLSGEDVEPEMQVIRRVLHELREAALVLGRDLNQEIGLPVIRWHLERSLKKKGSGFAFMTGGVTFCAMLPMRSIPFKLIGLVGMHNNAYPRESSPPGFDLMSKHPKPGDRSRRNDDRYLFLEAIISSRERLYISYVGQSSQDNSPIPPSVLVSELVDTIEQGFKVEGGHVRDHILTRHRLQPFSPEYFKGKEKLFSFAEDNFQAAQTLIHGREGPAPFISKGLSEPDEALKTVDLEDLCRFFLNPARFLLNKRLGVYLDESASILEERESFNIEGLEKYLLEKDLLEKYLEGWDLKELLPITRAAGQLPHGAVGECLHERLREGVVRFGERMQSHMYGEELTHLDIDLSISGLRLTGRIRGIYPDRLIRYRYARVKPEDRLKVWVHHLLLNTGPVDGYPRISLLAGLDPEKRGEPRWAAWEYGPVEKWEEVLHSLMAYYWEGLIRPAHFFPASSWSYARDLIEKRRSHEEALARAQKIWAGNDFQRGERKDAYFERCFGNRDPFDSMFAAMAKDIFGPLMAHQGKIE